MLDTLYSQIGAVAMVLIVGFAFWKGEEDERIAAGALGIAWFASLLVQDDGDLYTTQWSMMAVDVILLGILGALVWKSRKSWTTWATAMQLLVVMSHLLTLIDVRPSASSFYFVINLAGYGVLLAIAVGTFWTWQERRAAGLE